MFVKPNQVNESSIVVMFVKNAHSVNTQHAVQNTHTFAGSARELTFSSQASLNNSKQHFSKSTFTIILSSLQQAENTSIAINLQQRLSTSAHPTNPSTFLSSSLAS